MDIFEKICRAAESKRGEVAELLKRLAGCDTTDYHEANGQAKLLEYLDGMDCEIAKIYPDEEKLIGYPEYNTGHSYEGRYNVVARFKGSGDGRSLIAHAHMDTVFPASPDQWRTDPFVPVEKDGKIYALGAVDDKGGMSAMLVAMKLLKQLGVRLKGDVLFESVVDEEAGGGNGTLAVIDAGFTADAALVAEPTRLNPMSAQIGSYAVKVTVAGKSAHANTKSLGVSAFEKALPLINRLRELERQWQTRTFPLLGAPVVSVLRVETGDGSITLPSRCELLINFTYLPDGYDYAGELKRVIAECEKADPWFDEHPMKVALHHDCGPCYTDPNTPWPAVAAECAGRVLGEDVRVGGLPTGADARLFVNVAKIPCVIMGPGDMTMAHNPNEYVEIDQLVKAVAIYAATFCRWCGFEEPPEGAVSPLLGTL